MPSNFLIEGGVIFKPKNIDASAIREVIAKSVANAAVKISKFTVNKRELRKQVQSALNGLNLTLRIGKIDINRGAISSQLSASIREASKKTKAVIDVAPDQTKLRKLIEDYEKKMAAAGKKAAISALDAPKRSIGRSAGVGAGAEKLKALNIAAQIQETDTLSQRYTKLAEAAKKVGIAQGILAQDAKKVGASFKGSNAASITAIDTQRRVAAAIKASTEGMRTYTTSIQKSVVAAKKISKTSISTKESLNALRKEKDEINKITEAYNRRSKALAFAARGVSQNVKSMNNLNVLYSQSGTSAELFGAKLGQVINRFSAYLVSIKLVLAAQRAFNATISSISAFDEAILELAKVTDTTRFSLTTLTKDMIQVGRETGTAFDQLATSMNEIVRLGLQGEEALNRLKDTMLTVNVTELNVGEATNFMTSTWNIFQKELVNGTQAVDILSQVADKSAASATELAQSLIKSGAAANAVGVSYKQLTALTAATVEQTKISANTIGAAFKTIFSRIVTNTKGVRDLANSWGANVEATDGVYTILRKISGIYGNLNKQQRGQLSYLIAGRRRFTELAGLLQSFARAEELVADANNSAGVALRKNAIELQKFSTQVDIVKNNLIEFVNVLVGTDQGLEQTTLLRKVFSDVVGAVNAVVTNLTGALRVIKSMAGVSNALGSIFVGLGKSAFLTIGVVIIKQIVTGMRNMLQLGASFRAILLQLGNQQKTFNLTLSDAQKKEQQLLTVEKERLALNKQINIEATKANAQLSSAIAKRGRVGTARNILKDESTKRLIGATALITTIQITTDVIKQLGDIVRSGNTAFSNLVGNFLNNSASAANLGTQLGVLTGSIRFGVLAGLGSLASASIALAVQWFQLSREQHKAILEVQKVSITAEKAARLGEFVEKSFREQQQIQDKFSGAIDTLGKAVHRALDPINGVPFYVNRANRAFADIVRELEGTLRRADIQREVNEFNKAFKNRVEEFQIKIDAGLVSSEFSPVLKSISEMNAAVKSINPELETQVDILGRIANSYSARLALLQEHGKETSAIIRDMNLESETTKQLEKSLDSINKRITEEVLTLDNVNDSIEGVLKLNKEYESQRAKIAALAGKDADYQGEIEDLNTRLVGIQNKTTELLEERVGLENTINKLNAQQTKIHEQIRASYEKDAETIKNEVELWQSIINNIEVSVLAIQNRNAEMEKSRDILMAEADARREADRIRAEPGGSGRETKAKLIEIQRQFERELQQRIKEEKAAIVEIERTRDAARQAGLEKDAERLDKSLQAAKEAYARNRQNVVDDLTIKLSPELEKTAQQGVRDAESKLADFRIEQTQQALELEQRFAEGRIAFIEEFGDSFLGLKRLEGSIRGLGNLARKTFGDLGALIIKEQSKSATLAAKAVIEELDTITKRQTSAEDQVAKAVEARGRIQLINEELIGKKREAILGRVREISESVATAEKRLVDARNKIPELNAQIIESEKSVTQARTSVEGAVSQLISAYQDAADATANYRLGILKAAFDVKVATGALDGPGAQLRELSNIYKSITSQIKTSQSALLDIQKSIAEEALSIYQNQLNSIKGLGIQIATASNQEIVSIAEGLSTAAAILKGSDIGGFSAEQLGEALKFKDLFAGLEQQIAEFGLEQLGVDSAVLKDIESEMLELAKISAESGKQQVDASYRQVAIAQTNLARAEEEFKQGQEHLTVAKEQKQQQLNTVQQLAIQYSLQRASFTAAQQHAAVRLRLLNDQLAQTKEIKTALQYISALLEKQQNKIREDVRFFGSIASNSGDALRNAAAGSLTNSETRSILAAAKREKSLMPAGSNLMLANTSEVVLTRNQAKMFGLQPSPKKFAADGNAQATGLENAATSLNVAINALMNRLNSPGFVQQNISVQVDSERKVNVTGLDAIENTVKRALEERFNRFASKEEQQAINDIVVHIVDKLQEMGVVNSIGE